MSYSSQFRGSPWQQGRQPFDVRGYAQMYGGYGLGNQFSMSTACYNQDYRGVYGSSTLSSFRSMGYGSPSVSGYFSSDRMKSYQDLYGQMRPKRLSPRSVAGGPETKRPRLENGARQGRSRIRFRRDSRRTRSNKLNNKLVDSAENMSNTKYNDYDSWKSSEDENDTSVTQDKEEQLENDVKIKTDISDKTKGAKTLACHVCKVTCSNLERFGNHMTSRTHMLKIEKLLLLKEEKEQVKGASTKASQRVESQDRSKRDKEKRKQWCTVCEFLFSGKFLAHRRSKEHRKNRDKKFPKCKPCGVSFKNAEEYKMHCKEEQHKAKSAEFYYIRSLTSGSDDDAAAIEPAKVQTPISSDSQPDGKQSSITKEIQPVGQMFVVSARGFYCKICRTFFREATVAKVNHCCSIMHSEAVKKAMKAAMKQEEERQKLSEEREKFEEKTAEVDPVNAQVAAGEKTTEEEKGTQKKADDTESEKSSDQSGNASVEKVEVSIVAGVVQKEEVTGTRKEIEGNGSLVKVETSDVADVVKEPPVTEEKIKGANDPLPHPVPEMAEIEGRLSEATQPDSQEDKECEGTKKESPGSRGGRRRGRGRRR